jgi:rhodanese-related sulfurtransferase
MSLTLIVVCVVVLCAVVVAIRLKRSARMRRELAEHSITPEDLHARLTAHEEVLVLDVRQPLDMLADAVIIPGAKRIAPREIIQNPSLIPKDKDAVVYCTCPGDESSKAVLQRALNMKFSRVKFLTGGLNGWKAKGYQVESYAKSFHLDTGTG